MTPITTSAIRNPDFKNLDILARLMDSRFKVPGTNIRFGFDALIGLIPGAGDFAGFLISGYMLTILAQNGASGFVMARMLLNVIIDAALGAIPILGDLFDIAFKANERNMRLMREHYVEGRHRGGAWKIILPVLLVLLLILGALAWASYEAVKWLIGLF